MNQIDEVYRLMGKSLVTSLSTTESSVICIYVNRLVDELLDSMYNGSMENGVVMSILGCDSETLDRMMIQRKGEGWKTMFNINRSIELYGD